MEFSTRERESLINATAALQANAAKISLLTQRAEGVEENKVKRACEKASVAARIAYTAVKGIAND